MEFFKLILEFVWKSERQIKIMIVLKKSLSKMGEYFYNVRFRNYSKQIIEIENRDKKQIYLCMDFKLIWNFVKRKVYYLIKRVQKSSG